jgi:Fic family protein
MIKNIIAPNKKHSSEIELILQEFLLASSAKGGGLSTRTLSQKLNSPKRSIQRLMATLVNERLVQRKGQGRSVFYTLTRHGMISLNPTAYLSLPAFKRKPVGYRRAYLEKYIPNKSFFLNKRTREELLITGQTSGETLIAETFSIKLYEHLLVDLSWASSNLEGNTFSLLETERLLNENIHPTGKSDIETQMILNHKEAIKFAVQNRLQIGFDAMTARNIHSLLSDSLLQNPRASGRLREIPVGIDGSTYVPPNIPSLIEEQFNLFLLKFSQIKDPFEASLFCLVFLPYIQPFEDLNKRTARVFCNLPLLKKNLIPISFLDIERDDFIKSLLSVYELNNAKLLIELIVNSYKRTALKYKITKNSLIAPHPLKIKYRQFIQTLIANMIKTQSYTFNESDFENIPKQEKSELKKIIDLELSDLHEGNFARYQVTPTEFLNWSKVKTQ